MKNFTNETSSELLTQLMDGELDSISESSLYDELAGSPELQYELKNHLAVRSAIQKDTEAFTPPAESVKAIFESLGYAPPPNVSNGIIRRNPFLLTFFKRAAVPLAILLIGSFTAYNILNTQSNDLAANGNKSEKSAIAVNNQSVVAENISKQSTTEIILNKITPRTKKLVPVMNSSEIVNSNLQDVKVAVETPIIENKSDNSPVFAKVNTSMISLNNLNNISFELPGNLNTISNVPELSSPNSNTFAFYVKGINNLNSDLGSPFANNENSLNNVSLGVTYLSDGFLKIGFELGQQRFSTVESSSENELTLVNSTQSVFWYALTFKHDADYLEVLNVQPFVQGAIGSGNFGKYMYRLAAGLEYKPFNSSLGFIAGYENSNLFYSIQNNTQSLSTSANCYFIGMTFGF
jgi:hypothetical protein